MWTPAERAYSDKREKDNQYADSYLTEQFFGLIRRDILVCRGSQAEMSNCESVREDIRKAL